MAGSAFEAVQGPEGPQGEPGAGAGLFDAYAYLRNEQSSGTAGGTPTTGSYQTYPLNTEVFDTDGIVALSSNEFTLGAGTYYIEAQAPFYEVNRVRLRLRNVTDAADIITGPSYFILAGNQASHAHVRGRVTLAGAKALALQYRVEAAGSSGRGMGVESSFGTEVYGEVEIWREA